MTSAIETGNVLCVFGRENGGSAYTGCGMQPYLRKLKSQMICKNSEKFKFRVDKCRLIPQKQGSVLFKSCRYLQYTIIKPHISSQHQFIDIHTSTGGSWGPWSRWQSPRCSAPRSAWPRSRNNVTCHVIMSRVMCHVSRHLHVRHGLRV